MRLIYEPVKKNPVLQQKELCLMELDVLKLPEVIKKFLFSHE
jgi:hypothetical protein